MTMLRRLFGPPPFDRLAHPHTLVAAADAFFGVSLAGSLFFNVSLDAARPRIVLYLLVTMAPFVVVAPFVGPFVDRLPGGQRMLIAVTSAGRGIVCLNLAGELRSLLFYPLAFSILVLGKTYSVAKNTLIPRLVDDSDALVGANARLSRLATYAGALAALPGVAILNVADADWVLRVASVVYLGAAGLALRLPRPRPVPVAPSAERQALRAPGLRRAASEMGALRAAVGFVLFLFALSLKRSGEPTWFFGMVFAAHAAGGFAGTFVAPRLRRTVGEERLLRSALAFVGGLSLLASLGPGRPAVTAVALVLGTSASTGRQAFDSLVQRDAPDVERGRLFARFETRFQLAWVLGALVAVLAEPPIWVGLLLVGAMTGLAAFSHLAPRTPALGPAQHAAPGAPTRPLPTAAKLMAAATALAERGEREAAVVLAAAAAGTTSVSDALGDRGVTGGTDRVERADELGRLRRRVLEGAAISTEETTRALDLATSLLPPRDPRTER